MGVTSCGRRPHEATVLYVFNWIAPRSSTVPFGVPIEQLVYNSRCGPQRRLDRLESAGVVHVGDQGAHAGGRRPSGRRRYAPRRR